MRATIWIRDRIGETENLVAVAVVILHDAIDEHFIFLPGQNDRLGMDDLFVLSELLDELLDAVFVYKALLLVFAPFIRQHDFHARIKEGQLSQAVGQNIKLEFSRDRKNRRVAWRMQVLAEGDL